MKDLWSKAYDLFIEEYGKEPTDEEHQIAYLDLVAEMAEYNYEQIKEKL